MFNFDWNWVKMTYRFTLSLVIPMAVRSSLVMVPLMKSTLSHPCSSNMACTSAMPIFTSHSSKDLSGEGYIYGSN